MKKQLFVLLVLFLVSVVCIGQKVRNIPLHYNAYDFPIALNNAGQLTIKSTKHIISFKSDVSAPALPYVCVNVLIAPSEEYVSISLTGDDIMIQDGYVMANNPVGIPSNMLSNTIQIIDSISYRKASYPNNNIEYTGISKMGGYKILSFLVCPFKYDATKKKLYFISDITITLLTRGMASGGFSGPMSGEVEKMVVNNDEVEVLYNKNPEVDCINQRGKSIPPYEYLIVTNETLKPTFQKLSDWKTQKGILTKILTTEEISSDYSGNTLQERIKNALKDYYDNTQHSLTYVLLGGSSVIVPEQMCYAQYNSTQVYQTYAPADLYYACFDTMDWDSNCNGIYGQICDSVDILPEIYVTRAPVKDVSAAAVFVDRVISYETNPNWNSYSNKVLMVGCKAYVNYYDNVLGDSVSDSHYKSDWLYRDYINSYLNGNKVRFYDTGTDFPGSVNYQLNPTNLQTQLAKSFGFVHVETHGTYTGWCLEDSTYYMTNEALNLNNCGQTIVLTAACHTNAFHLWSCLSKDLIKNPNSGILAYVGSSHYSWYFSDQDVLGSSNELNGEIFKHMFSQADNNFGKVVAEAKNQFAAFSYTYDNSYRWLLFFVNPMGDPEMPIFTTTPQHFSNIAVSNSGGIISVNTNIAGCRICITRQNDNTTFLVGKNTSTFTSPALSNGEYNVCITKPGYIPYNIRIGINQDIYIQNETITADVGIIAPNVFIGENVSTTTSQGPVNIEQGRVDIKLQNEVLINNSFEVKRGAILEIKQ